MNTIIENLKELRKEINATHVSGYEISKDEICDILKDSQDRAEWICDHLSKIINWVDASNNTIADIACDIQAYAEDAQKIVLERYKDDEQLLDLLDKIIDKRDDIIGEHQYIYHKLEDMGDAISRFKF